MVKKSIALAVALAFAAPAATLAQSATVQVYGKATMEYGYAEQGGGRPNTDIFQTPGGSIVGFKGEEQLGGGLSAWFQCESSADVRGLNQDGFCGRNSAIGVKGAFGNLHLGRWDTPFKRATLGTVGFASTGLLGASFLLAGNSTGTGAIGGQGASQALNRNVWKRRESGLAYYESPQFNGFQVLGAFSAANATAVTDATTNAKPRIWSIASFYSNGPMNIALAYEKHVAFGNGFTGSGFDDRGWTIGANYAFTGGLQIGAQFIDTKYEMGGGTDLKKVNWLVGANWNFSGPHHILGGYINAGDSRGSATTSPAATGNGALAAPNAIIGGIVTPVDATGAHMWEIAYQYDFSKRTNAKLGYVKLDNDTHASYSLGGLATPGSAASGSVGTSQSAWVLYAEHKW